MSLRYITILLAFLCSIPDANARAIRSWSYEELIKASDLVAVIEPVSSTETKDAYPGPLYGYALTDFMGHNTEFKVHAILKGDSRKDKTLTVLHFSYSKDIKWIANGARFARFVPGPLQFRKQVLKDEETIGGISVYSEEPVWLAFLKKRDDGRYEPVTDPYDSTDSFRELHQASFYIPVGE